MILPARKIGSCEVLVPEEDSMEWWGWLLIAVAMVATGGFFVAVAVVVRRRNKNENAPPEDTAGDSPLEDLRRQLGVGQAVLGGGDGLPSAAERASLATSVTARLVRARAAAAELDAAERDLGTLSAAQTAAGRVERVLPDRRARAHARWQEILLAEESADEKEGGGIAAEPPDDSTA
ncbi:MAG: hypothetical protein HY482_00975 [Candidatus Wildermuthbacteria bacterium]|nr:hypothetical protein [Candidatus Wildermuthbacteria bacterium]